MNYTNMKCELCQVTFTPDDDIVVCPDCGSPMHRACWNQLSHCANQDKHATGFTWTPPFDPEEEARKKAAETAVHAQTQEDAGQTGPFANLYGGYNEYQTGDNSQFGPNVRVLGPKEKLGNYTVEDYGNVIQKNVHRFIPKFFAMEKSGRKVSWNWMAFFFPAYWAFYRKMYKVGALLLALSLIIPIAATKTVSSYYVDYFNATESVLMSQYDANMTEEEYAKLQSQIPDAPLVLEINSYIQLAIRIAFALFANYLYKLHVENILKKEETAGGTEEEKACRLKKVGGTSWLAVVLCLLAEYAITAGVIVLGAKLQGKTLSLLIGRFF